MAAWPDSRIGASAKLNWSGVCGLTGQMTVFTVSQITEHIKETISQDPLLSDLWLSGEISNFKLASSGHCYFTLKDQLSSIRSVIWRSAAINMHLPRDGDAVLAHGYVSVYELQGAYQFYCDHLEPAGIGRLWAEFERLKTRLTEEGLFDPARKRALPSIVRRIGVVTSPNAAALRDILQTLSNRFPLAQVILSPAPVQGEGAAPAIAVAISALNRFSSEREPIDCLILARGGGSIEDLWPFNDERVARAIAASEIPVISGVGHETDVTIADFAADVRAPTPTGAAVRCVPDIRDLKADVSRARKTGAETIMARLYDSRSRLENLQNQMQRLSPAQRLASNRQRIDDLTRRGILALRARVNDWRGRTRALQLQLRGLDPAATLGRGYAIVSGPGGDVISSVRQVSIGERLSVRVADGQFGVDVTRTAME